MKELAFYNGRNSFVLVDPDTGEAKSIKPHEALILANANGFKLTDVIDGARVKVRV